MITNQHREDYVCLFDCSVREIEYISGGWIASPRWIIGAPLLLATVGGISAYIYHGDNKDYTSKFDQFYSWLIPSVITMMVVFLIDLKYHDPNYDPTQAPPLTRIP